MRDIYSLSWLLIGGLVVGCSNADAPQSSEQTKDDVASELRAESRNWFRGHDSNDDDDQCGCGDESSDAGEQNASGGDAGVPDVCPLIFDPVCGCDGITYSNSCFAAIAQVAVDHEGACEDDENACAAVLCPVDTQCVVNENGEPMCEAIAPTFCGGIAGIACPGNGECVDDPSDECNPEQSDAGDAGGNSDADCGGICECNVLALCIEGFHFDASAAVCDCVADENPCAAVTCLVGNQCVINEAGEPVCEPVAPFCGGIAGFPCPGAGVCVDDPSDECDPENGGADCGGLCECGDALILCAEGTHFDQNPAVCACVPDEDPCASVRCGGGRKCVVNDDGEAVCKRKHRRHHHHGHRGHHRGHHHGH
jgi:hypothetical protein